MKKAKIAKILLIISLALPWLIFAQGPRFPWGRAIPPPIEFPTPPLVTTIERVFDILFYAVVVIAVAVVIWGGIKIATAAGNTDEIDTGRRMILGGLIAVVVGVLAWGAVNLIVAYLRGGGAPPPP